MSEWNDAQGKQTMDWLLEESNPSVRWFTLKSLLDKPEGELAGERENIMKTGKVPEILALMRTQEYGQSLSRFYTDKYTGLSWQLLILAELGASKTGEVEAQCETMLSSSQEKESGAFAMETSVKQGGGRKSATIPCLTGNMIFALSRLGYAEDERVIQAAEWLAENQRYDDGDGAPSGKPACWGDHSCYMGVVKALKGFAALPPAKRSPKVRDSIRQGTEFLMKHHVYKQSHNLSKPMKPGWMKFSFPLMYQTDALEMLLILGQLGIRDERMREAVELVQQKRNMQGRWLQESTFGGKFLTDIEPKGQSKWITLRALEALKMYFKCKDERWTV
jgi:hypothetical protein